MRALNLRPNIRDKIRTRDPQPSGNQKALNAEANSLHTKLRVELRAFEISLI